MKHAMKNKLKKKQNTWKKLIQPFLHIKKKSNWVLIYGQKRTIMQRKKKEFEGIDFIIC